MSENNLIGETVARSAEGAISLLIANQQIPSINTRIDAMAAIDKIVTQDPTWQSWRVWSSILGAVSFTLAGASAVLVAPEAAVLFGPKAPVIAALLAAVASGAGSIAALLSRHFDPRPIR